MTKSVQPKGPARLKRNLPLLHILAKASPSDQKIACKCLHKDCIQCLADCCKNILNGNIPLTASQKQHLLAHKKSLRLLANKSTSVAAKKRIIARQKGGFLSLLIKPVLSVLGSLFNPSG